MLGLPPVLEVVRDPRPPERVRRYFPIQARLPYAALHHVPHGVRVERLRRQRPTRGEAAEKGSRSVLVVEGHLQPSSLEVGIEQTLERVMHRRLDLFASFFSQTEEGPATVMVVVAGLNFYQSAHAAERVEHRPDDSPVEGTRQIDTVGET